MQKAVRLLLAAGLVLSVWLAAFPAARHAAANSAGQTVTAERVAPDGVTTREDGLSFVVNTPSYTVDGEGVLSAPGLTATLDEPGSPAIPFYRTFVALPPEAEAQVVVTVGETSFASVGFVRPAPDAIRPEAATGFIETAHLDYDYTPDATAYATEALYPTAAFELSAPMYYRDARVVQIDIFPLRYNPAAGTLVHAPEVRVDVAFVGGTMDGLIPAPSADPAFDHALADMLINYDQSKEWRSLPLNGPEAMAGGMLPLGVETYKIEVNQEGIHEVTYADLVAAGITVGSVNPNTFEMMWRGQSVAYQFIGDADTLFEAGESIRFYAWPFDGTRPEKEFVTNNVYWLWYNGTANLVGSVANDNSQTLRTNFPESTTKELENAWFPTWSNQWDTFPNEPDAWYWTIIGRDGTNPPGSAQPKTDVIDPDTGAATNATATVEVLSQSGPPGRDHILNISWVLDPTYNATTSWPGIANVNISMTVPINELIGGGDNRVRVELATDTSPNFVDRIYLNRITWDYLRLTQAVNDSLQFGDLGGVFTYDVSNFTTNDALVWNVTDRLNPDQVNLNAGDITGAGPYTFRIGSAAPAEFLATTETAVLSPVAVTEYIAPDLTPSTLGPEAVTGAQWVAIVHNSFVGDANLTNLVNHRSNPANGGLSTAVFDVEDIYNQFGGGLPTPWAINAYLTDALANWQVPPTYVVMVGDATNNPRKLQCKQGCPNDQNVDDQLVPTHLPFVDRFQGQIISDTEFTFLVGNDFLPDLAIGRLPAKDSAELGNMVNKIVEFENSQIAPSPVADAYMGNMLYVSDDTDAGGNFCLENQNTEALVPASFSDTQLCLPNSPTVADVQDLKDAMYDNINITGTVMLNYRGHGDINGWGFEPIPITDNQDTGLWANNGAPIMVLSADCLDGYFAMPAGTVGDTTRTGMGEAFAKINNGGTAAHWSSSGLGFSVEHTVMHEGFYEGLFDQGITNLGDIVNYAKIRYVNTGGGDISEVIAFTLLGDPAMRLMRPDLDLTKTSSVPAATQGQNIDFYVNVTNNGTYPSKTTITDTLPVGMVHVSTAGSVPHTVSTPGNDVVIDITNALGWMETAYFTITVNITANDVELTNVANVVGAGFDYDNSNNSDSAVVTVGTPTTIVTLSNQAVAGDTLNWQMLFAALVLLLTAVTFLLRRRRLLG